MISSRKHRIPHLGGRLADDLLYLNRWKTSCWTYKAVFVLTTLNLLDKRWVITTLSPCFLPGSCWLNAWLIELLAGWLSDWLDWRFIDFHLIEMILSDWRLKFWLDVLRIGNVDRIGFDWLFGFMFDWFYLIGLLVLTDWNCRMG